MNYICIIPARSGSKRIKNKNILKVKNKKLFDYTLESALKVKKIKKIIITTNIEKLIRKNSKKIIYIRRPKSLCKDNSTTESAMQHSINYAHNLFNKQKTAIILLQPTSPLRNKDDIKKAIDVFEKGKYDSLFSAYKDKIFFWKHKGSKLISVNYSYKNRMKTGYMKKKKKQNSFIVENGAIYIFKYKDFNKFNNRLFGKIGYSLMSKNNSLEIDYPEDIKTFKHYIYCKK